MSALPASPTPAGTAAPSAWCLRFLNGALRGRTIALKPGANLVGSAGDCDVMLPGGDVLPQHLLFSVGELVVSVQKLGAAGALLNGEPMQQPRRSVVAGDVLRVGAVEFQLDRVYVTLRNEDRMFAGPESALPPAANEAASTAVPRRPLRRIGAVVMVLALAGIAGVLAWQGEGRRGAAAAVDLPALNRLLAGYPEVETVAAPNGGGAVVVRGFVETRARRKALQAALEALDPRVSATVVSAEEMVEQARRFVSDPGVTVAYAGQGRLVVSGTVEDEAVRLQIRRLAEDLHPTVLVSDKVVYRAKPLRDDGAASREQWASWQSVLPSRMVGITEDANGLKHIQLANGSRYYEGSVLKTGGELQRIDTDGLVISGGTAAKPPGAAR